ncbi:thiamine pyrophosphate-dependent dehydrogenase E1 component subunit alpha [Halomarina pelagica]|uniref:thiamine pyrophosphate-dependent dehydrogenase E1 component subunit alpha n=1 Tax=Halomarina pelagica TaxID=2961599 RepID=UPI0020C4E22A|nr:thiamine pyrophosphate-dependent enzyme [Halomarina sp. BND7]
MSYWTEVRPREDFYRVLDPDGSPIRDPPDVDEGTLRRMYWAFVRSRAFDEKALRLQRRGEISIHAASVGEEAVPIGTAAALEPGDWCFPTYRQTAAMVYWDASLAKAFAGLMGTEPETTAEHLDEEGEPAVNFSPPYVPLTVNVTNAVGSAMADRFNDRDTVTMSYVGDGSTSEGDFHEALNFAGVFEAPAVTICHNNQWAISVPTHRQTAAETFAQKAEAHGVPHDRVDGNDVLAVYEKTREAVDRARGGEGPTLLECVTYRMVDHNTADEDSVYRDETELERWAELDPVDRFEAYLRAEGVLDDEAASRVAEEAEAAVDEAVAAARAVPESDPQRMFDHHLHGESWTERHQRAELRRELAGENPFVDFDGEGFE